MWRLRVTWSGSGVVGPGLSTFYAADTSPGFPAAVRAFYQALVTSFPTNVTITVPNGGDVIDPSTGVLTGAWTDGTAPLPVVGTGAGTYAAGVGAQVRWRTLGVVAGRRVVGSTFLIPLVSPIFDSDGTITAASRTVIQNAANAYVTAAPYGTIWSRPYAGDTTPGHVRPARAGSQHIISGAVVPDRPSWLVSRRR